MTLFFEVSGGVNRITRPGTLDFDVIDRKQPIICHRKPAHRQSVLGGCQVDIRRLVRRAGAGDKNYFFKIPTLSNALRATYVPVVYRIETSAETESAHSIEAFVRHILPVIRPLRYRLARQLHRSPMLDKCPVRLELSIDLKSITKSSFTDSYETNRVAPAS